jgi:hypothetical protein
MANVASVSEAPLEAEGAPPPHIEILPFDIVPRIGLVISGVLIGGVIAAIATNSQWALDGFHVAGGAVWTVLDLFLGFVLGPIMGSMSVPARIEFITKLMPKMVVIMPTVVTITLASGWQLATKLGTNLSSYPNHGWVVASFIVVGVMSVIALGLLEPANIAVLTELKKRRPNPEVIERLMKRFMYSAGFLGAMQIATLIIMSKIATG